MKPGQGRSGPGCGEYKVLIRTNIRIYLYQKNDTNEYPNIFVSNKLAGLVATLVQKYDPATHLLTYSLTRVKSRATSAAKNYTNEYPNIFVSIFLLNIIESKNDTN